MPLLSSHGEKKLSDFLRRLPPTDWHRPQLSECMWHVVSFVLYHILPQTQTHHREGPWAMRNKNQPQRRLRPQNRTLQQLNFISRPYKKHHSLPPCDHSAQVGYVCIYNLAGINPPPHQPCPPHNPPRLFFGPWIIYIHICPTLLRLSPLPRR